MNFSKNLPTQKTFKNPEKLSIETRNASLYRQEWEKLKLRESKNLKLCLTPIQKEERKTLWFQIVKELLGNLGASDRTFFTAIQIYDNFILKNKLRKQHLKKLCLAIMDLAIKLRESKSNAFPILKFFEHFNIRDPSDIVYLQKVVLESFNFDLNFVSEWDYLEFYLRVVSERLGHLVFNWEKKKLILRALLKEILIYVKMDPEAFSGIALDEMAGLIFSAAAQRSNLPSNFLAGFCELMGFGFREFIIEGRNLLRSKIKSDPEFVDIVVKNYQKNISRVVTQES